ncbi:MAG: HD-GYP domain-containing protein, partial [Bacillota bacterium]|nr:HD-GYP domain-containing protein [Bacillota bacterium]
IDIRENIINNDNEINIFDKRFLLFFNEKLGIVSGLLLEIGKDKQLSFSKDSIRIIRILKNTAESYFLNESIHEINESFQKEIIFSIIQMLEIHDEYTKGHSESVADLASRLARYIGFSEKKVNEIYWTGLVHDIGKILIDKSIITKEGKLTLQEFEIIKKHPEFGYKALRKSKVTRKMAEYVLSHHERIDGLGYPDGLMDKEIPIESKIISIVDSYDAMISTRSYRSSISTEEALQEIENNLDAQFDKEIGLIFIKMINDGK